MNLNPLVTAALLMIGLSQVSQVCAADEPFELRKLKDRPGKELFKAAYGKGGRLGAFQDVMPTGSWSSLR